MALREEFGQIKLYDDVLELIVRKDHSYRKILNLVNFKTLLKPYHSIYSEIGAPAYPIETAFKCLLIQFMENLSDRELENYLQENNAAKWFCGFALLDKTPDHSFFGKFRKRFGLENLTNLFNSTVEQLRKQNVVSDTFTFVDTTAVVSKVALWEERDKAIEDGMEKLNNKIVDKYATDKDARFGSKGKRKFWFGFKLGVGRDVKEGIITKPIVSPANKTDAEMFDDMKPPAGAVLGDKGFDTNKIRESCQENGLHSMIIQKNNRKEKNQDLDKYITKLRCPFESIFTQFKRRRNEGGWIRTFYRGLEKINFEMTFKALAINLRRVIKIMDLERYQGLSVS